MGNNKYFDKSDAFILPVFFYIFQFLGKISLFTFIRWIGSKCSQNSPLYKFTHTYVFSELWVLFNLMVGIVGTVICARFDTKWIIIVFLVCAIWRTFSIFVYQFNVLLFDPLKNPKTYAIKSSTRMVLLLIINMIEYVIDFSVIYMAINFMTYGTHINGFKAFAQSFAVFASLSGPDTLWGTPIEMVAFVESIVGLFMNLLCIGRFVGLLPQVNTIDGN